MYDFKQTLLSRCNNLDRLIDDKKRAIKAAPEGRVTIDHSGGYTYYYLISPNGSKKKLDEAAARMYIQKSYDKKIILAASRESEYLKRTIETYPADCVECVIDTFPPERQRLIEPVRKSEIDLVQNWLSSPYNQKPVNYDRPVFKSDKGDLVKSKSELIIANKLFEDGVPYRYEAELNLGGVIIHPDFTIFDVKRRREVYWEHLGRMDDGIYVADNLERFKLYSHNGIIIGDRLFLTMESLEFPLDMENVDSVIALFK